MIRIDRDYLVELGLGALPDDASTELIAHIYDTLETRVGGVLAEAMGPEAVDQFAAIDEADPAAREAFLAAHVPDYKGVGEREFVRLTQEIKAVAPQVLALEGLEEKPVADRGSRNAAH